MRLPGSRRPHISELMERYLHYSQCQASILALAMQAKLGAILLFAAMALPLAFGGDGTAVKDADKVSHYSLRNTFSCRGQIASTSARLWHNLT